jgi:CDP-2,3-bis-(O-geranylgeranyl)-sn-glycerol synthase
MNILFQVGYFLLPAALCNMMPVFAKKLFPKLGFPLDFNKNLYGSRILGSHKTFRGLISGLVIAIFMVVLQTYLYNFEFFKSLSYIHYSSANPILLGFLIGFGTLFGDALGSFFKRRFKIEPGKEWMPVDQIDSPIFMILFILPVVSVSFYFSVLTIIIWFFGHLILNYIGWLIKIKRSKF